MSLASLALTAAGTVAWTGCGPSSNSVTCDNLGVCMQCDGYGCTTVSGPQPDAGVDALTVQPDAHRSEAGETKPDAHADAKDAAPRTDAKPDVAVVCGGSNGPCACKAASDCTTGEACVDGACEPASSVCVYSSQCAGNEVCADGQCVASCSASTPCSAGFTCTKSVCEPNPPTSTCTSNSDCTTSAAPYCVSGACTLACTADAQCPNGDYCDQGACVLDTRPSPDCTTASDCDNGQICQGGYCLYTCTGNVQCEDIDARIPVCVDNVCRSPAEAAPACTSQADCTSGQDCISNTCQ